MSVVIHCILLHLPPPFSISFRWQPLSKHLPFDLPTAYSYVWAAHYMIELSDLRGNRTFLELNINSMRWGKAERCFGRDASLVALYEVLAEVWAQCSSDSAQLNKYSTWAEGPCSDSAQGISAEACHGCGWERDLFPPLGPALLLITSVLATY